MREKAIKILVAFFVMTVVLPTVSVVSYADGTEVSDFLLKNFGGAGYDQFEDVIAVEDGFIAVGFGAFGDTGDAGTGDYGGLVSKGGQDAVIVKFDADGNVLWKNNFGGSSTDQFNAVAAMDDGGFIAVGSSYHFSFGNGSWEGVTGKGSFDAIIVKFDADGNVLWKNNFGGSGTDQFNDVAVSADGSFIVVGDSNSDSFDYGTGTLTKKGGQYATILKITENTSGTDCVIIWAKNFGGNNSNDCDSFNGVAVVDGGAVAVGDTNSLGNGDWIDVTFKGMTDASIVKFNDDGTIMWKKRFGGPSSQWFYGVTAVDGGVVAVGDSYSGSFNQPAGDWYGVEAKGSRDAIIVKYNNSGNVVWKKNFSESVASFNGVTTVDGGVIAVGYGMIKNETIVSTSDNDPQFIGKGGSDAAVVKFDGNGMIGDLNPGDYAGFIGNNSWGSTIVKYDNSGNVVWKKNIGWITGELAGVAAFDDGAVAVGRMSIAEPSVPGNKTDINKLVLAYVVVIGIVFAISIILLKKKGLV